MVLGSIRENTLDTIQKNTEALLDVGKEVGMEVNPEKTKTMLISRCRKAGQRQSIKTASE
jgi:coproporphyrinogen III oxidase-like Fe-S oxidoreductase